MSKYSKCSTILENQARDAYIQLGHQSTSGYSSFILYYLFILLNLVFTLQPISALRKCAVHSYFILSSQIYQIFGNSYKNYQNFDLCCYLHIQYSRLRTPVSNILLCLLKFIYLCFFITKLSCQLEQNLIYLRSHTASIVQSNLSIE